MTEGDDLLEESVDNRLDTRVDRSLRVATDGPGDEVGDASQDASVTIGPHLLQVDRQER